MQSHALNTTHLTPHTTLPCSRLSTFNYYYLIINIFKSVCMRRRLLINAITRSQHSTLDSSHHPAMQAQHFFPWNSTQLSTQFCGTGADILTFKTISDAIDDYLFRFSVRNLF